jgi:hypothetical protein
VTRPMCICSWDTGAAPVHEFEDARSNRRRGAGQADCGSGAFLNAVDSAPFIPKKKALFMLPESIDGAEHIARAINQNQ